MQHTIMCIAPPMAICSASDVHLFCAHCRIAIYVHAQVVVDPYVFIAHAYIQSRMHVHIYALYV